MKKILLLTSLLLVSASCSHITPSISKTKAELIEDLIATSDEQGKYEELVSTSMSLFEPKLPTDAEEVIRSVISWEKYKALCVTAFDQCYTKEDILFLIELNQNPEYKEIRGKDVRLALTVANLKKQLWSELRPKLKEAADKLPPDDTRYFLPVDDSLKQSIMFQIHSLIKDEKYAEAEKILTSILDANIPSNEITPNKDRTFDIDGRPQKLSYIYRLRAGCWRDLQLYDKALDDYRRAQSLQYDADSLFWIARCKYELGDFDEALTTFDKYLMLEDLEDVSEFLTLYYRALCVVQNGDIDDGLDALRQLQIKFPDRSDSIQQTIEQCEDEKYRIEHLDETIREFKRLQAEYPENGALLQPKIDEYIAEKARIDALAKKKQSKTNESKRYNRKLWMEKENVSF